MLRERPWKYNEILFPGMLLFVRRSVILSGHQRNEPAHDSWKRMLKQHHRIIPRSWSDPSVPLFEVWYKPWLIIARCAKECTFLHNYRKINGKFACSFCFWRETAERIWDHTWLSFAALYSACRMVCWCNAVSFPILLASCLASSAFCSAKSWTDASNSNSFILQLSNSSPRI